MIKEGILNSRCRLQIIQICKNLSESKEFSDRNFIFASIHNPSSLHYLTGRSLFGHYAVYVTHCSRTWYHGGVTSSGNSKHNSAASVDSQAAAEHCSRGASVVSLHSTHNSVSLPGHFVPPHGSTGSPSTVVCLQMALPPGGRSLENDCYTKPQTGSHSEQTFLQNYPPVGGGVTGQALALHSSSASSVADPVVSSPKLPNNALFATSGLGDIRPTSTGVQISPASGASVSITDFYR